jgi:hypothetical protein
MLAKKFTHGISFFVEHDVYEQIKKEAENRRVSVSAVVRDLICEASFIQANAKDAKVVEEKEAQFE